MGNQVLLDQGLGQGLREANGNTAILQRKNQVPG